MMKRSTQVTTFSESSVFDEITGPAIFITKAIGFSLSGKHRCYSFFILLLLDLHFVCFVAMAIYLSAYQSQSLNFLRIFNDFLSIFCAIFACHHFLINANRIYEWKNTLDKMGMLVRRKEAQNCRKSVLLVVLLIIASNVLEINLFVYNKFDYYAHTNETTRITTLFLLREFCAFSDCFVTCPANDFYVVFFFSVCLVCSVYVQGYGRFIENLRRPQKEVWHILQTLRIDLTSAIKDVNDIVYPLFFLWTLQLACYIPVVLNSWKDYSENVLLRISFSCVMIKNVLEVVVISFSAAKVYQEGQKCISKITALAHGSDQQQASLLTTALYINPPQMTAWNFFTITKGIILTVAGGIFTYAILIYQLRNMEEPHE